ncbi:MAG: hypothetical protein ACLFUS_16015 [Candidatus Sumerlaeia bacterium]
MKNNNWFALMMMVLVLSCMMPGVFAADAWVSPQDLAWSPDGKTVAIADRTAAKLYLLDGASGKINFHVPLNGAPNDVAWTRDGKVLVAEYDAGSVAIVDAATGEVSRRITVSPKPFGVAVAPNKNMALVCGYGLDKIIFVDLASGQEVKRIDAVRQPAYVAITPDESLAVVGNHLPLGPSLDPAAASNISIVDMQKQERVADIVLPDGSSNVREIEISPDGKWAYAAHTRGRPALPTTQLDRGWVNTNAMSIIDLEKKELYTTILLDLLTKGAADPWGVAVSPDGKDAWVSISGTHEVARLDLDRLHKYLEGGFELAEGQEIDPYSGSAEMIWSELKENPAKRLDLVNNLAVLHGADLMKRFEIKGSRGLRGLDISPDGKTLAVASYFTGEAIMLKPESMEPTRKISLGKQPEMTMARRGEKIFFDGNYCFQSWLSCGSCHADGRVDGLNWDLLNDGIGNPKNAKSLLWSHKTPPVMSLGVRASMEVATQKGFEFIQFTTVEEDDLEAVHAYLRSMEPEASPYLVNGKLSEKAEKGKKIFESREVGCSNCHPAPLFTDLQMYDVGTRHELDREDAFDNPTLVEMWRSGPYLHDGSATSIYQLFKEMNPEDKHGKTSHLSDEELRALEEYVLSL